MIKRYGLYISIALVVIGFVGISYFVSNATDFQETANMATVENPKDSGVAEVNKSDALNDFLATHRPTEQVSDAYSYALANPDGILDEVPCYCGCLETNEHLSNRDCFIEHPRENSDQLFDEMGLNCGVCVATALDVKKMAEKGKTLDEIKQAVDEKYLTKNG